MNINDCKDHIFAFVILHYCSLEDTLKCVESIQRFVRENYEIIIVDNNSFNGTGAVLKERYKDEQHINVLLNSENLGFAKGNNVGFKYAKKIGADFICMTNSDTYLIDGEFCKNSMDDYTKYGYFVLGPNIHLNDDSIQSNPMDGHVLTRDEANKKIWSLRVQLILAHVGLWSFAASLEKKNSDYHIKKYDRNRYYENVKLHGSCWVFSPDYVREFDGICDETFMYLEEDILYMMMVRKGYKTLYSPRVQIFHAEDGSTNFSHKGKEKQIFCLRQHLNSMKVIYKLSGNEDF